MYLYVELWRARPEWLRLPDRDRESYLERIMQGVEGTKDAGAELIGFALNEPETPSRADYTYVAAWRMRDRAAAEHQDQTFRTSGWLTYFDQTNARGEIMSGEELVEHQLSLKEG